MEATALQFADWRLGVWSQTPEYAELLHLRLVEGDAPLRARARIDELAALVGESKITEFSEAMALIRPRGLRFFVSKWLCKMPLVVLDINSFASLAAAARFVDTPSTKTSTDTVAVSVDVSLVLNMPTDSKEGHNDDAAYLLKLVALVVQLKRLAPRYRIVRVTIDFESYVFRDARVIRAASKLCREALAGVTQIHTSISIPHPKIDDVGYSLAAWGELFQSFCRIGAEKSEGDEEEKGDEQGDNENAIPSIDEPTSLRVRIVKGADTRLVTMFWSAIAFSRGYTVLEVDESLKVDAQPADDQTSEHNAITSRYTILALISQFSDVKRFDWTPRSLCAHVVQAMEHVHRACSRSGRALAPVLWHREWSQSRDGHVFEIKTLNKSIVKAHGWVLHDTRKDEWIDVFVAGFG